MFDKLLRKLGLPFFDILGDDGTNYLTRFYIYRGKRRPHIYLHHIWRSDYDRACHDHPWDFVSLILWGGYVEHQEFPLPSSGALPYGTSPVLETQRKLWPLAIVSHRAEDRHRLELTRPAWTLVFTGAKRREWGFWTEQGWIAWYKLKEFIADMMP